MKVRLFAALREIAGASMLEIDAPDVGSLLDQLSDKFGSEFARIIAVGAVVVDGETVDRGRALQPDDDVALLPPVSGGAGESAAGRSDGYGLASWMTTLPRWTSTGGRTGK
jgi:MoaD family protein